jgi:hypothetical protein
MCNGVAIELRALSAASACKLFLHAESLLLVKFCEQQLQELACLLVSSDIYRYAGTFLQHITPQ